MENYKTFPVLIEKEIRKVNKDGNEDITTFSAYLLLLLFLCKHLCAERYLKRQLHCFFILNF